MTVKEIAAYLADKCGKQVSLPDVWSAKQDALEFRFGTYYDSYNYAPRLLEGIVCSNSGSFIDIKDTEVVGCKDFRVLHSIFWALAQCIHAFHYCRPVLCVKGTPLCGRYQGVLLTALALDANDCQIPVAFAIVESETKETWLWFLRNMKQAVVRERAGVCIIHDCKVELVSALDDIQNNPEEPHPWKDVRSRWCMLHLAENFLASFGDKKLMTMFKRLCQQKKLSNKFTNIWKELDELTFQYMAEKESSPGQEMQQGSSKHDDAELEAQIASNQLNSVRDGEEGNLGHESKRRITKFSDWIHLKPKEKWSLLYDTKNARYGIMGTDISDVYKSSHVCKGILCLPLSAIVEVTFKRTVEYFKNTSAAANETMNDQAMKFPQRVQDEMNCKMQKAQGHQVICMKTNNNNVLLGEGVKKFVVQSGQKRAAFARSENTPHVRATRQLLRKPCSHVIAVCCQIGVSTCTYMSPYYSVSYLCNTWSRKLVVPENLRNDRIIGRFSWESKMPTWISDKKLPTWISDKKLPTWIPDKKLECVFHVSLTSDSTQTGTDEEEQEVQEMGLDTNTSKNV
ncbi:hypothetical protein U9M48_029404 [Paspalum notatum var. saurae]|uniref:MULE transposase domain-containing protein n=1 Tax=Paspalum notatum var. saurae TaxID=547442 RepID=A0AAQ3U1F2_PASNO